MIRRQSPAGYDTVYVRMSLQSLSPGMQNTEKPDLGTEASRIGRNFQQGCGTGIEQESEIDTACFARSTGPARAAR